LNFPLSVNFFYIKTSDNVSYTLSSVLGPKGVIFIINLQIERIQNPDLWNSYQAKKKTMDAKNGHKMNEKQLFHGTDAGSVPHVNKNGFNRSYAGKNGKKGSNLAAVNEVSALRTQAG
jgi:hypothetical protein